MPGGSTRPPSLLLLRTASTLTNLSTHTQLSAAFEHGAWAHTHAASRCFLSSLDYAEADRSVDGNSLRELRKTVRNNVVQMDGVLYPYSYTAAALSKLLRKNIAIQPGSALQLP